MAVKGDKACTESDFNYSGRNPLCPYVEGDKIPLPAAFRYNSYLGGSRCPFPHANH